eukprot:5174878-Pleurochrysis_carterae.AAC.3
MEGVSSISSEPFKRFVTCITTRSKRKHAQALDGTHTQQAVIEKPVHAMIVSGGAGHRWRCVRAACTCTVSRWRRSPGGPIRLVNRTEWEVKMPLRGGKGLGPTGKQSYPRQMLRPKCRT